MSRSATDWVEVLARSKEQGLGLSVVVKDAAKGIEVGVREVFPDAEQRDDCFHALYEMNKVRRRLEKRAYGAIAREVEAEQRLKRIRACQRKRRVTQRHKLVWARRQCEQAIERYDEFEAAMEQAREAMQWVDLEQARLRSAEQVRELIEDAARRIGAIDDPHCRRVGAYLRNRAPGLALAMGALRPQLDALSHTFPEQAVVAAAIVHRLLGDVRRRRYNDARHGEKPRQLLAAWAYLTERYAGQADEVLAAVEGLLEHHHRASSAIEGFNAALRPYLYVHKGVTPGFLELFRAHYNLRTRRWGRHKGTSAHQCLTGKPVDDWLSVLGYPPSGTLH